MSIRTLVLVFLLLFALVAPIALAWQHALTVCPVTDAWFGVNFMNGALVYFVVEVAALTTGFLVYTDLRDMECPKFMVKAILAITPNLATITANKAKESVMTMRLFFAIILTIAIFVPMALIATFQEAFVCILGLGPLAFTAIDLILHVEYHYCVREYVAINKELRQVQELRRQLHAQFGHLSQFKHLFGPMLLCLALAGLGGCGEVKVDETDYLDSYATEAYEMNALRTAAFPHPGVGVYAPQDGMQCTGWAWQGKMYSITHCSARGNIVFNKTGENPDPVVEVNVNSIHAAPVLATDLYTVGAECSPDLRWWGATTGEWRSLKWDDIKVSGYNPNNKAAQGLLERWQLALDSASQALLRGDQAFAEMQVASAMYIKAQWEVMTTGQRYCFASGKDQVGSAGFFRQGDSGGVLLAGDEPIGSVSYSNASETENCFSATQTEKTPEVFMAKLLNIETEWKADHLNVAYEPQGLARIVFKSLTVKAEKTQIAEEANMVTVVWILIFGGLLAKIFRNRKNEVSMERTLFVGDVHTRHELVAQALRIANGARIIFLGDIFDGPQGAAGAKKCLDLIRGAGAEMVLGNHELYPLFAKDKADLIRLWSLNYEVDEAMGDRVWEEWMELRALLTEDDLEWLRSRPLWVKGSSEGRKWIAVHAQVPKGRLPGRFVNGTPTLAQIALVDGTNTEGFWAESYAGRHGLAFIGHTRRSKLNGRCQWANVELLDWDAKKGAPGTAAIAEVTANSVIVKPVSPVGGKESVMALIKKGLGILALAWALVACSPTAEPVPAGMGQIVAAHNGECSAFHWQGEIRTAAHCTWSALDWRDNTVSVLHQEQGKMAIPEDLAEVGVECSPDLFWWGATTGKTLPVQDVKFYAVKRGTNVWDLGEEVPAWTPGAQVCFRQSLLNGFSDGDSGGPLLAGDEPIGSVSWSSSLPWGMACFGRLERTKPTWGGYVPTNSPQGGKGFRMKSIDTGSLAVTQVLTDLAIAGAILALAWLLARIRAKFRENNKVGNSAGNNVRKDKEPLMGVERLACTARFMASVIAIFLLGVCLLAAPGAAPLVASNTTPAIETGIDPEAIGKLIRRWQSRLAYGMRMAKAKCWSMRRLRRWLVANGYASKAKPVAKPAAKAPAKTTRKGMSRQQARARAHLAKVAETKAEAKVRRHDRKVAAAMVNKAAGELALAIGFFGLIARVARHQRRMEVSAARSLRKVARKATPKLAVKKVVVRAEGAGRPTFHPRRSKVMGYNPMAMSRQEIVTRREKREERRRQREEQHLNRLNGAYAALLEMAAEATILAKGWTLRGAAMYLAADMAWVTAQPNGSELVPIIAFEKKEMEYETAWAVLKAKDNKVLAEIKAVNAKNRAKRKAEREERIATHRAKVEAERAEREAAKAVKAKERAKREAAKAQRLVEALVAREAKKGNRTGKVDVTPVSPVAKLREVRAEQANTPALAMIAGIGLAAGMFLVAGLALVAIVVLAVRKNRAEDTVEDTAVDADWGDLMDAPPAVEAIESEPQPLLMRLIELLPEAPAVVEAEAPAAPARYRGQAFEQLTEAEARALEDALDEPPFTDPGDWDGGAMDEEYAAQLLAGDQEAARRDAAALEEHLQVLAEEAAFDEMIENGLDGVELVEKQEGEQTPEQIWASICTQLGVSTRNRSAIDAMNILIEMYQRKVDLYRFRHFGITRSYTRKQKDGSLKSGQTKTLRKDVIVRFASVLRQDKEMATWFAEASHDPSWEQFWPSIEALMKDKKQSWDAREWRTLRTRYEGAVQIVNDLCIEFLGKAKNNLNFRGGVVSCLASKDTFRYRVVDAAEAMAACKRINAVHRGGFCVARGVYQQQMQQGSHLPWVVDKLNGEGNWEEFGFVLTTTAGIADWGFGKHNRSNKSVELKTATEMLGGIVDLDHQKPERQFIEMFHKAWVSMRKPNLNDWKTFVREAAEKISPLTRSASFEVTKHEAKNGVIYSKAVTDFGTTAQTTYTFWNDGSETTCRVDSKLGATPKGFSLKFQSESKTIKKFFLRNSNYRPLKVLPWEIVPDEKELLGRYLTNSWKLTAAVEQAILRNAHHGVNYTYNELIMSIIREGFASWRELNVVTQEMSTVYHIKTHKPLTLSQLNKQNSILASLEGDYFVAETTLIPAPKPAPKSLPPIRSQYSISDDYYNSRNNPDTLIALFKRGYQWMASPSGYQLVSARKAAANPEKILKGEALATVLDAWIRATLKIQAQEGIDTDSCENIADRFQMNLQSLLPGYVCSINAAEITSIALRTVKSYVNKLPDSDSPEVLAIIAEYFKQLPGHEEKLKLDREARAAELSVHRAAQRAHLIAQGLDPDAEIPFCRAGAVLSVLALAAGLPAIAVVLPLAVTAVLAFIKMRNSDLESEKTLADDAAFCLYSTPIFRHTTGNWTAVTDNKNTEESPSVEAGESQKEKPMSFLNKMNQTIQNVWNELTGREKVVTEAKTKAPATYGSILASSKVEHTALTRICGAKIREMQVTELSSEDLREIKDFIRRDGDTWIIIRDSQKFHFPNWAMEKLVSEIVIAGHAVDKKVSQQEVNKYFGSLLWAPAEIVSFQASEAKVMSDGLAAKYDGTNLMSDELASSINWVGYAIRRLLTVLGLFKGMFIILPAGYFPPGVKLFGSEVKKHLRLRRDSGRALALQPQANGHSDVARTLGMQLWSMLLGPWIASVGFANLAKGAYGYAMSNLNKANERLLSPAEEEEDGRDALMAEASRQHGFNPIAVFRSFATSMANGLTKSFNPNKVNIAPVDEKGRSLVPNGYPMMLPWLALAELWLKVTGKVPEELARKVEDTEKLRLRLFKLANGAIPVLVHNMHRLDAAKVAGIRRMAIAAIATRIPTGKTSGIEVILFDAEEYGADLLPEIVGRKKNDIEFWLFPCEETTAFKVASEGGDDDDLYEFLLGILHKLARLGLEWRAKILDVSAETQKAMDEIKVRFARQVAAFKEDRKLLAKLMEMPYAKVFTANGKVRAGWPSLLGVTMAPGGWQIRHTEAVEDIIVMTEKSREDIATQARLFAEVMTANNDSPFTSAIGTVAQSHKFATGILTGNVVLTNSVGALDKIWALFVLATILLSDMVDACNKGKKYAEAGAALMYLNWAWGWLCYRIASNPDAKVICPAQYLVSVPPAAKELFNARHANAMTVDGKTVQPGKLLNNLYDNHRELGETVEAMIREEHNRAEFSATVTAMLQAVSVAVPGAASAQAMGSEVWAEVWTASGRKKIYLDGLKQKSAMRFEDIRAEQRYMAELNNVTVYAAHAQFDRIVMGRLVEADPNATSEEIAAMFKLCKLGMVYSYAFKTVGYEENCVKVLMDEEGEFGASGGVPTYIIPVSGNCTFIGNFAGSSEILLEWMMNPATLALVAEIKAKTGDFKYVALSMKGEAFGEMVDGGRDLTYTEANFDGKSIIEILCMPGVALAGNQREESHVDQSTWLASVADTVTQRRNDLLRRLKTENKAAEALLRGKTFGELLQEFNVNVVAESVTGTATVEKIEAFKWMDKKHQGRTYPNTFVIVRFSNEAGPVTEEPEEDEITIIVGDEVTEAAPDTKENVTIEAPAAAATVVAVPMTAEEKKQDMGNKLNRIFGKKEAEKSAAPVLVVPPAVVEYEGKMYAFYNVTKAGTAKLLCLDGTKYTGTPAVDKLKFRKAMPTKSFNGHEYFKNKSAGWVASCSTGNLIKDAKIMALFDENPQPPTPTKSTTLDLANRLADKANVESKLGLPEDGASFSGQIQTPNGSLIASGYARIVYGDHGPYIEFAANQVSLTDWDIRRKGETSWYDEARLDGVMLYLQKKTVATLPNPPAGPNSVRNNRPEGYADYKPGMIYVDPWKVKIVATAPIPETKVELKILTAPKPAAEEGTAWIRHAGLGKHHRELVVCRPIAQEIVPGWTFFYVKQAGGWQIFEGHFGATIGANQTTQKAALADVIAKVGGLKANKFISSDLAMSDALFDMAQAHPNPEARKPLNDLPIYPATPVAKEEAKQEISAPVSAVVVAEKTEEKPTHRCVGNFALSGLKYSRCADTAYVRDSLAQELLVTGTEITLVRDLANGRDANAVEVYVNDYHFGYIPKETAAKLAPRMDIGTKAWATITGWENGFVRFDLFLGKTPTVLETFNFQRDEIDRTCDKLMTKEVSPEEQARSKATLAHFAVLCGSLKL